ncbi:MAG: S-methyl-5-thioribose-1-phosphate isomerase [Rhodocyclaceae bacterium]|nr:S-methyl-5-thioribose-1-phosphate isomerase [Rhodocyclaceae bacterium]
MQRWPTLIEDHSGAEPAILILDQTRLPAEPVMVRLDSLAAAAHAIRSMQVRGAPLIGVTAAYGVVLGLGDDVSDERLGEIIALLAATRPTAVNLHWALARMEQTLRKSALVERRSAAWQEAKTIAVLDGEANAAIGRHGAELMAHLVPIKPRASRSSCLQIMTHCNAGRLATAAHGTAIAPIYALHSAGQKLHVWVSETRPRNQGLLTAWELAEAAVPHTLIVDNAAGLLMRRGEVDCVIVGADRIAGNGDVANKVGTYLKALAAKAAGIPFFVAAPCSTIDFDCPNGEAIVIEERDVAELGAPGIPAHNPAFDVTPAELVTAIISEYGVSAPGALASWQSP